MARQHSYSRQELEACGRGELFGSDMRIPIDEMLMVDRITFIDDGGGKWDRGELTAEFDIRPELWFFRVHFPGDPVMPGCLGLDALWQLLGFYLAWSGGKGRGRALGAGEVKFFGQVLPDARRVSYRLDIRRVIDRKLVMGIADGSVAVDDREIYSARGLRVGLFTSTDGF